MSGGRDDEDDDRREDETASAASAAAAPPGHRRRRRRDASAAPSYAARPSSGRPGSPHRYFQCSYDVELNFDCDYDDGCDDDDDVGEVARKRGGGSPSLVGAEIDDDAPSSSTGGWRVRRPPGTTAQVVHRHANGLCIVTAGNVLGGATMSLSNIRQRKRVQAPLPSPM